VYWDNIVYLYVGFFFILLFKIQSNLKGCYKNKFIGIMEKYFNIPCSFTCKMKIERSLCFPMHWIWSRSMRMVLFSSTSCVLVTILGTLALKLYIVPQHAELLSLLKYLINLTKLSGGYRDAWYILKVFFIWKYLLIFLNINISKLSKNNINLIYFQIKYIFKIYLNII